MSSNNFTCRDKYCSYGSYLRSRGYDKEICALVTDIEQGKIPIGPIIPGSCPNKPTIIKNDVTINPCQLNTGILRVNGGSVGKAETIIDISSTNGFLAASSNYGIQSNTGIRSLGPIVQVTDCSHYNFFGSKFHIFGGGIDMQTGLTDCSTNVVIRGNLLVDGSTVELGGYIGESLDLITLPSFDRTTFRIFRSSDASGNMVEYYVGDNSGSIITGNWKTNLTYAVDGNRAAGGTIDGASDTQGHVRSLRGITVSNPPQYNQPIDICYNIDISGTSIALDVYGDIIMNSGNNGAPGNIDLSGGSINFYENGTNNAYISSNGDASFNGHLTVTDLSVINVMTVGTATTFVDTSNVKTNNLTIRSTTNPSINFSTFSESPTGLSITAGATANRNIKLFANKTTMNDASMLDVSAQNLDVSNTTYTPILNVGTTATINEAIIDSSLVTNFIRSKVNNDLTIRAAPTGNKNVVFDANKVVISDLSVNTFASIFDLSVINTLTIGPSTTTIDTSGITCDTVTANTFIGDISSNDIVDISNAIATLDNSVNALETSVFTLDNSVNALETSVFTLDNSVNALETTISNYDISFVTPDLSVNYAYINDLSVNNNITCYSISAEQVVSCPLGDFGFIQSTEYIKAKKISSWPDGTLDISADSVIFTGDISSNSLSTGDISGDTLKLRGNIVGISGDLLISNLTGRDLKMVAGTFAGQFTDGNIIFEHQNAKTTNIIDNKKRTLTNYGSSTSVLDISASFGFITGIHDLKLDQILYSDLSNSSAAFSNDISNNLEIIFSKEDFSGSIVEIFAELPMKKLASGADAVTLDLSSNSIIHEIDTRSIAKGLSDKRRAGFGPITLLFNGTDNSSLDQSFNFRLTADGGPIETSNIRLTIKQKSII